MHASKQQQKSLHQLVKRSDFVSMNSHAKKWIARGLIVQVKENELGHKRVGYTITKKTENSAVKRNRIKRRLRAVAADILPVQAKDSCDYVLIGRTASATRPYETLANDLKWCLKKMGYLKET